MSEGDLALHGSVQLAEQPVSYCFELTIIAIGSAACQRVLECGCVLKFLKSRPKDIRSIRTILVVPSSGWKVEPEKASYTLTYFWSRLYRRSSPLRRRRHWGGHPQVVVAVEIETCLFVRLPGDELLRPYPFSFSSAQWCNPPDSKSINP